MAKTFIGELVLALKDNASGPAKTAASNIAGSIDKIEAAARKMSKSGDWGSKFEAQIRKLGASSKDLDQLRSSWSRLQEGFAKNNIGKALQNAELSNWKTATLRHFSDVAQSAGNADTRVKGLVGRMRELSGLARLAGFGYVGYQIQNMGREGIIAASNEQRERAKQHFAGLPKSEQNQIETRSEGLATKYRVTQADVMEIMLEARLAMPDANKAFAVAEPMIQAFKMLSLTGGSQRGIEGLRAFNKAMDNINVTENSDEYTKYLNSYVKAQQITGKDMDPEAYAQAIKFSRTSGKVFGSDFLQNMLPFLIAESGGPDAGTQLRSAFDQFVGGRATKRALAEQGRLGLRDKDGKLTNGEAFAQDPVKWVNDYIIPALKRDGVDLNNKVDVAQAVSKLASDRLAKDFIQRSIYGEAIYKRLREMQQNASGIEGAKDVDTLNPFAAYEGFISSLKNLAGAVGKDTLPTITAGLNSLADNINAIQKLWGEGDTLTKAGVGAGALVGAYGAYKGVGAIFGLVMAGTNLNAAAASLQAAAVSLAGGGNVPGLPGDKKGGLGRKWPSIPRLLAWGSALSLGGSTANDPFPNDTPSERAKRYNRRMGRWQAEANALKTPAGFQPSAEQQDESRRYHKLWDNVSFEGGMHRAGLGAGPTAGFQDVVAASRSAGQEIQTNLNVTASPKIDTASLERAANLVNSIKSGLASINAGAVSVKNEMNRNFADHGVSAGFGHR